MPASDGGSCTAPRVKAQRVQNEIAQQPHLRPDREIQAAKRLRSEAEEKMSS